MQDSTVTVVPAVEDDAPAVLQLLRGCGLPLQGVREGLARDYVVARMGHSITGVCGLEVHGTDGLLRSMAVGPAWRGRGIAEVLLEATLNRARRLGLHDVYLLTTTARDYFARRGFTDCARAGAPPDIQGSWEFQTGCPTSSACMRRRP
jgi:amino-acid N-acetyltransferase